MEAQRDTRVAGVSQGPALVSGVFCGLSSLTTKLPFLTLYFENRVGFFFKFLIRFGGDAFRRDWSQLESLGPITVPPTQSALVVRPSPDPASQTQVI